MALDIQQREGDALEALVVVADVAVFFLREIGPEVVAALGKHQLVRRMPAALRQCFAYRRCRIAPVVCSASESSNVQVGGLTKPCAHQRSDAGRMVDVFYHAISFRDLAIFIESRQVR